MVHASGYDKVHSLKFPGVLCNLLFWYLDFFEKSFKQIPVIFISKIIHKGSRDHAAHSGDPA